MRRFPTALLLVLCMAALGACTARSATPGSGDATISPTPAATSTVDPRTAAGANPMTSGQASPDADTGPCASRVFYSVAGGIPGQVFIRAQTIPTSSWGEDCGYLNTGDKCRVTWTGGYSVPSGDAYLRFQGWAKGAKKPFKEFEIGPLVGQNAIQRLGFPIVVPKAQEVAFRLVLEDAGKAPVAESDAFVYKVDCRPK
jgi:hypothetical protein